MLIKFPLIEAMGQFNWQCQWNRITKCGLLPAERAQGVKQITPGDEFCLFGIVFSRRGDPVKRFGVCEGKVAETKNLVVPLSHWELGPPRP